MQSNITSVIFSKNRACQLDLLIRSIMTYWQNFHKHTFKVIYTYDNNDYEKGYNKLIKKYSWVTFLKENDFKNDLISCLDDNEYFTFFTDDDIFKNTFNAECAELGMMFLDDDILCLSLRLGKHLKSHPEKGIMTLPDFDVENCWNWRGASIDWGYPMSVSGGHIYRTKQIAECIKNYTYDKAWNIECALSSQPINKPKMICFNESIVFHNAINRVQTGIFNKCGNIDAKFLNDKFLEGNIILHRFDNISNESVHENTGIEFERMV